MYDDDAEVTVGCNTTLDCKEFVAGIDDSDDEDVYDKILLLLLLFVLLVLVVLYWMLESKLLFR